MPRGESGSGMNAVTTKLSATVKTLEVLSSSFKTPFLAPICVTVKSILDSFPNVKQNMDDCIQLLEQIFQVLQLIVALHIKSDTGGELSPGMLSDIGNFTKVLHKAYSYLEAQQGGSRIKRFFRQAEMSSMLKSCNTALEQTFNNFRVKNANLLESAIEMQEDEAKTHEEVLELIAAMSDTSSSDSSSTMSRVFSSSYNSSASFSMLPSEPKIFYGRESELSQILKIFKEDGPRIAILGAGGMGKTSLVRAVLHHNNIAAKYTHHRFFVACDTVSANADLISLIGAHLGLQPGKDKIPQITRYLTNKPASLLVLDNFETVWEPVENRTEVEELLSVLTSIEQVAVIITMRGAERPAKVLWSRPFLAPLQPLSQDAARKIFADVSDEAFDTREIDEVLLLTDNMPLAVDLIAHAVESEGCATVLSRWEQEKTSLVSEGFDKRSNLDVSISLSLSSPRLVPQAKDLLSLLSLLPDGLSDAELVQSSLPIENILVCKVALLRTSLAYLTSQKRLKVLVPIGEYVRKYLPPKFSIVDPLFRNYEKLLDLYREHQGSLQSSDLVARIKPNFANAQSILSFRLQQAVQDRTRTIYCGLNLNMFSRVTGQRRISLMDHIPAIFPRPIDPRLEVCYANEYLSFRTHKMENAEGLIQTAFEQLPHLEDSRVKCQFYNVLGTYYQHSDPKKATDFFEQELSLAVSTGSSRHQTASHTGLANIKRNGGDFAASLRHAHEAQRISKLDADLFREARALHIEGLCWMYLGNYSRSVPAFEHALSLVALCGLSDGETNNRFMGALAEVCRVKSEYIQARDIQMHLLQSLSPLQDPYMHAFGSLNVADLEISMGIPAEDVMKKIDIAQRMFKKETRFRVENAMCTATLADLDLREGNFTAAKDSLESSLKLMRGIHNQVAGYCLEKLADTRRWSLGYRTLSWPVVFLLHSLKSQEKLEIYKALQFLGDVILDEDDQETAFSLFTVALEGFTQMDIHRSRADCMLGLGDIASARGDIATAREHWTTAGPLFERSSQDKRVALVVERISTLKLAVGTAEV